MTTHQHHDYPRETTSEALLALDHVTLLYDNVIGVNDIHIELPHGAYALIGPNGAGKSTLIGLLTGALIPTIGSVRLMGEDPHRSRGVLTRVGLCPASDLLIHNVSARRWIELQLKLSGWPTSNVRERSAEVLELVGLGGYLDRSIHTYSLGMRQRCKLAQAMAHRPQLLILDEPFNGLDPIGRHQMTELLIDWAEQGKSLLLASHVLHEVEQVTDSFLLIYGGRLLASGTSGELHRLLANLPQQVVIFSQDSNRLAGMLASMPWLKSLERDPLNQSLIVAVDRPIDFFQSITNWILQDGIVIDRLLGTDGDISSLFRLLVSRHRGELTFTDRGRSHSGKRSSAQG